MDPTIVHRTRPNTRFSKYQPFLSHTERDTEARGEGCPESSTKLAQGHTEPRLPANPAPLLLTPAYHPAMVSFIE